MWSRREGMTSLRGRSAPVRRIGGGGVSQARPGCSARATRGKRCAPRRAAVHTVGRDATARDWGVVSQRAARARVRVPLQAGDLIDRWSEGDRALSASGTGWRSAGARTWTWPRRVRARGAGRDRVTGLGRPTSRGPTFAPQPAGRQSSRTCALAGIGGVPGILYLGCRGTRRSRTADVSSMAWGTRLQCRLAQGDVQASDMSPSRAGRLSAGRLNLRFLVHR